MSDPLQATLKIGASGLQAQSMRLRVIAENMANAHSTGRTPGSDPYTRKVMSFESEVDDAANANLVRVAGIERHRAPYRVEHHAGSPRSGRARLRADAECRPGGGGRRHARGQPVL